MLFQFVWLSVLGLVFVLYPDAECRRFGGGGGRRGGFSWSRPSSRPSTSYSRPSSSHSTYHPSSLSYPTHSLPTHNHPASSSGSRQPIGFEHFNRPGGSSSSGSFGHPVGPPVQATPNHGANTGGGIGFKPSVTSGHTGSQSSGSNPPNIGFKASAPPAEHVSNSKPLGSTNTAHGTSSSSSGSPPPYGFKPSAPVGPPTNVKPVGNFPPGAPHQVYPPPYTPHNPGVAPPAYNPAHNPAGYGPPPPAYSPAGYGHAPAYGNSYGYGGSYPQQQYHPGGYGYPSQHYTATPGVTNININNINTNNHHYPGGYGGGYYTGFNYPSYHYSSSDVGSGHLGFFLGYSLAKLTTPTYYHTSLYNGYTPRYDHYEVHHYYHNRDSIPAQSTIQPNAIVGCVGDSGHICPAGTTSLCTSNGAILCVASATSTVPCTDQKQGNCVRSTIPCVNGTQGCEVGQNTTVSIPCISKAQVTGNITYVNNTIIVNQTTIINNNGTTSNHTTSTSSNSTSGNPDMTTIVPALAGLMPNTTSDGTRSKREIPALPVNDFCVTILALPAERKPTQQEQLVEGGANIFTKFLVRALGIK